MTSRIAASCRPRVARTPGFTLLEILLALALMAMLMVGVWGALRGATRITHSADAVMARSESVRTTQQFLRHYVSMAGMQPWVTSDARAARIFKGDAESMQFVAPLPRQSGHAGLYLQTVTLVDGDDGTKVLQLAFLPYTGQAGTRDKPVTHLLLADLRGGKFQYLAAAAFGEPAGWRDDWQDLNSLPLAVRIHLDPAWQARVPFPDLIIRLHNGEGLGTSRAGGGSP